MHITAISRRTQVCAQPWQTEIPLSHCEHFSGHQEEPPAGPAHHAVPDETDRSKGQFQSLEAQPAIEVKNAGRLVEFMRDGLEGLIPGEDQIPGLARKD